MNDTAFARITDALSSHGSRITFNRNRAMAQCPAHDDNNPSLSVTGIEGQALVHCFAGCDTDDVLAPLSMNKRDLFDGDGVRYRYDNGRVVWRTVDKKFKQPEGGQLPRELYRLSQLRASPATEVYLVEGEKDVHAIESVDGVATCGPMGASSFDGVDVEPLKDRTVMVVVDRDAAGDRWAATVRERLEPVARQVTFVQSSTGNDAADHVSAAPLDKELVGWVPYRGGEFDFKAKVTGFKATLMLRSELKNLPPVEPLIEGVVSRRSTVVLVGATGAGKTFLALSWACSIATGLPWLGRKVFRTPVLYVVGEGAYGLDRRIAAWEQAWGRKVSDSDLIFSVRPDSLAEMTTWVEMGQEAKAFGCGVVVLDTFSSLAPDADETKDAATITRRLADMSASLDATSILVHHPGWGDDGRTRGGYQLEANVDEVVLLRGNAQSPAVQLERKKVKEGQAGEKIQLIRRAAHGSVVIEVASGTAFADADPAERLLTAVFGEAPFTKAQLVTVLTERLEVSRSGAYETVTRLVAAQAIKRIGGTDRSPMFQMS